MYNSLKAIGGVNITPEVDAFFREISGLNAEQRGGGNDTLYQAAAKSGLELEKEVKNQQGKKVKARLGKINYLEWSGSSDWRKRKSKEMELKDVYIEERGAYYYIYNSKGEPILKKQIYSNGTDVRYARDVSEIKEAIEDLKKKIKESKAETYNRENFYINTEADFKNAKPPEREADYESGSGSEYWYEKDGVYRRSNHWGSGIASCDWYLDGENINSFYDNKGVRTGYAKWSDFKYNNTWADKERLARYEKTLKEYEKTGETLYQQLPAKAYDRNGKADINTPEFKKWFAGSKALDESGKPLIVYHGDKWGKFHPGITEFLTENSGSFFSSSKELGLSFANGEEKFLYPVYLNISKPLIVDYEGGDWFRGNGRRKTKTNRTYLDILKAKREGCDGVIIKNVRDRGILSDHYIVFSLEQIKSIYNRGTWDESNPNIYYQSPVENMFSPDKESIRTYKEDLRKAREGKLKSGRMVRVGRVPLYRVLGFTDKPFTISVGVLNKITKGKHNVKPEDVENLPALIADPAAVFVSRTDKNSLVAVVDAKDESQRQVITILRDTNGKVNVIPSMYGRNNFDAFVASNIKQGNLIYIDQKKASKAIRPQELQLLKEDSLKGSMDSILTKEDLVNRNVSSLNQGPQSKALAVREQTFRDRQAQKEGSKAADDRPSKEQIEKDVAKIKAGGEINYERRGVILDGAKEYASDLVLTIRQRAGGIDKRLKYFLDRLDFREADIEGNAGKLVAPWLKKILCLFYVLLSPRGWKFSFYSC